MDEQVSSLIGALTDAVKQMAGQKTGDYVEATRGKVENGRAFEETEDQKNDKSNKKLAEQIAEANAKESEEAAKQKSRKITREVMTVEITGVDKKALAALSQIIPTAEDKVDESTKPKSEDDSGFGMTLLKGLAYTALAAVVAPVMLLFGFFEEIKKQQWFIKLANFVKGKFWEPLKNFFKPVSDFFTKIKNSKFIQSITDKVDDIWKGIKNFGGKIKSFFKPITDMFTWVGKIFGGGTTGVFGKIAGFFNPTKNPVLKGVMSFAKTAGSVLGKIFLPITILMEAFNFVTGFMDGYEEGGVIGGLEQGVTDVFNSVIGWPLDMIKSGVSWILGAFGFEDAEKALDAFSFQDMFTEVFDRIFANIGHFFGRFTKLFDAFFGEGDGIDWAAAMESALGIFYGIPAFIGDMIKDGLSMTLDMFGFDGTSDWLDSFSLQDILDKIIGSLVGGFMSVIDWLGLLFTEPSKAFKQVSDWFDDLFADPIGTIKDALPDWMIDFGGWLYKSAIMPISDFVDNIIQNPELAKDAFLDMLPGWMTGFGEWVYDNLIFPVVQSIDKLLEGDMAAAFDALVPQWMKDFGNWLYDNTIKPLMMFFDAVEQDPEGTKSLFLNMLPDWMTGFGEWVWDNAIKPISDFVEVLFDDPETALMSLVPEWVKDIGGWAAGKLESLWDTISSIFESIIDFDFASLVPDWAKSFVGIDDEEEGSAPGEKTMTTLTDSGVSQDMAAYVADKEVMNAKVVEDNIEQNESELDDGLGDFITENKKLTEAQQQAIFNAFDNASETFKQTKLYMEVEAQMGGDVDMSNDLNKSLVLDALKGMKTDEMFGDDISDEYDDSLEELTRLAAIQQTSSENQNILTNGLIEKIGQLGGAQLGKDFYKLDGSTVVTDDMVSTINSIFESKEPAVKTVAAAMAAMGITPPKIEKEYFEDNLPAGESNISTDSTQDIPTQPEQVNYNQPTRPDKVAMDFIWRPGSEPLHFDKGDIVMGIHQDTVSSEGKSAETESQLINSSREMVTKMNEMVDIMNKTTEIQQNMLSVLTEAGLVDKQGDTVVNNSGGNSTVINNTTTQSSIMEFRDKVVGRIRQV